MDTDSAYMALSGDFETLIKPSLRNQFFKEYGKWFPRVACELHESDFIQRMVDGDERWEMKECCNAVNKYDQRTPGLFKEEYSGQGIISLNSKTNFCWGSKDVSEDFKCRSKGLSRSQNKLTKDQFMDVLQNKSKVSGINTGFRKINQSMLTYSQERMVSSANVQHWAIS